MKSDLATLAKSVSGSISLELGERDPTSAELQNIGRTRTVAGLRIPANAARDAIIDEDAAKRLRRLQEYRIDEQMLRARLSTVGVTPLAVLPLSSWERLLDMTGLYRFLPDKEGKVGVSTQVVTDVRKEAENAKITLGRPSSFWSLLLVPAHMALSFALYGDQAAFVPSFVAGLVLTLLVGGIYKSVKEEEKTARRKLLADDLIRSKVGAAAEAGTINSLLWPDFKSPKKSEAKIKIGLPDPTPEATEAMLAVERTGLPMHLAAVGEAIHLLEDPAGVLLKEHTRQIEMERRLADPIVFVIEGKAVAIVAQYGDFPIEQEVVEEVVNSAHLV